MFLENINSQSNNNKIIKRLDQNNITFFKTGNTIDENEFIVCIPIDILNSDKKKPMSKATWAFL